MLDLKSLGGSVLQFRNTILFVFTFILLLGCSARKATRSPEVAVNPPDFSDVDAGTLDSGFTRGLVQNGQGALLTTATHHYVASSVASPNGESIVIRAYDLEWKNPSALRVTAAEPGAFCRQPQLSLRAQRYYVSFVCDSEGAEEPELQIRVYDEHWNLLTEVADAPVGQAFDPKSMLR